MFNFSRIIALYKYYYRTTTRCHNSSFRCVPKPLQYHQVPETVICAKSSNYDSNLYVINKNINISSTRKFYNLIEIKL